MKKNLILLIAFICTATFTLTASASDKQDVLAFPTAEGYGKYTQGGRGGVVIEVTNLNDSGKGSLRAAVEAKGPRIVVFRVSGTIDLQRALTIRNPYITIAGQTAPGDGICLKRYPLNISADNVIIRHLRVRVGDESGDDCDAISCRNRKNIMLDHLSVSWSIDETLSVYMCENVTIQWCLVSESLRFSNHVKGAHGFGGIWGSNYSTYHHNLLAHHSSRNPRFASGAGFNDYRNNVIYNWGYNSCYGGEYDLANTFGSFDINMVGNYYKPGPGTQAGKVSYRIANPSYRDSIGNYGRWYIADNVVEGNAAVSADNWNGGVQVSGGADHIAVLKRQKPWDAMPINEQTAEEAYRAVLQNVGATLPKRDVLDSRIIKEATDGTATYNGSNNESSQNSGSPTGIIDSQNDVGGWPLLQSAPAPTDTDHDGMPDEWERRNNLNPNDAADRNNLHTSGYTAIEIYLNELCGEFVEGVFTALPSSPQADVMSVKYYDVAGRQMRNQTNGINIVRTKHADGTITVHKTATPVTGGNAAF